MKRNETYPYSQEAHHLLWETEKQTCRWQHSAAGAIREKWAQGRGAPGGSNFWLRQEDDMALDLEGWVIPGHSGSATELVAAPHHPSVHDLGVDKSPTRMIPWTDLRKKKKRKIPPGPWHSVACQPHLASEMSERDSHGGAVAGWVSSIRTSIGYGSCFRKLYSILE